MFQRYNTTRHQARNPIVPPMAPTTPSSGPPRHPLEGLLESVAGVPARLAGLSGELKARLRTLGAERGKYSQHEYEQIEAGIRADVRARAQREVEQAAALTTRIQRGADEIEGRHPLPPEDAGALARVRALVDGGHRPEQIIEFLDGDAPALRAYASSAVALHGARLSPEALTSTEAREALAGIGTLADRAAERTLPPEQQQGRAMARRLDLAAGSIVRHTRMVTAELAGQPSDAIEVGLADALDAYDHERAEHPIETGMEPATKSTS